MKIASIQTELSHLRDVLTSTAIYSYLEGRPGRWLRCCAAMDAIGDTAEGMLSFVGAPSFSGFTGGYLYVYGLLQCLYVQQDALVVLSEGLFGLRPPEGEIGGFSWTDYPGLRRVRDIRNEAIGHPAKNDQEQAHFISRYSLSKASFEYSSYSWHATKPEHTRKIVAIDDLLRWQTDDVVRCLKRLTSLADAGRRDYDARVRQSGVGAVVNDDVMRRVEILPVQVAACDRRDAVDTLVLLLKKLEQVRRALLAAGAHVDDFPATSELILPLRRKLLELREELCEQGTPVAILVELADEVMLDIRRLQAVVQDLEWEPTFDEETVEPIDIDWDRLQQLLSEVE